MDIDHSNWFISGKAFLSPSENIYQEIELDISADQLWPYIIEGEKRALWQTGVTSALPLTLDGFGLGSRLIVVYNVGESLWDVEEIIVQFEPKVSIKTLVKAENYEGHVMVNLTSLPKGRIKLSYDIEKIRLTYKAKLWGPIKNYAENAELKIALISLMELIKLITYQSKGFQKPLNNEP